MVEVGALDGLRFSNSLLLAMKGWRCLCVEAHPHYFQLLKENRPDAVNVFGAVCDRDGEIDFYLNVRGALSTIDPSYGENFRKTYGEYFKGFKKVRVPAITLNALFERYGIMNIDMISIDVEGSEGAVLKGWNLQKYPARLVIVESENEKHLQPLFEAGYKLAIWVSNNAFLVRSEEEIQILKTVKRELKPLMYLYHAPVPHFLDDPVEYEWRRNRIKKVLFNNPRIRLLP